MQHAQRDEHEQRARRRILRLPEVIARTGLCRTVIYEEELARRFPARVKLTARAVGWSEEAIEEWIAAKLAGRAWMCAAPAAT
jgi:prophage regulatory protein